MIEDPANADAIVEALDDPEPKVREQALWALSRVMQDRLAGVDRKELARKLRRAREQPH